METQMKKNVPITLTHAPTASRLWSPLLYLYPHLYL